MLIYLLVEQIHGSDDKIHIDFASYEGKYPNTLFNKGVRAKMKMM